MSCDLMQRFPEFLESSFKGGVEGTSQCCMCLDSYHDIGLRDLGYLEKSEMAEIAC